MKRIIMICAFLLLVMALVSCNGYNNIMYKHLSNLKNYVSVTGIIEGIRFYDADFEELTWEPTTNEIPQTFYFVRVSVQFDSVEEYALFSGVEVSGLPEDFVVSEHYWNFEIIKENAEILIENGFFDAITIESEISMLVSNFIYMDTEFFQIIQLKYNETLYLDSETGLQNFMDYMKENNSLF